MTPLVSGSRARSAQLRAKHAQRALRALLPLRSAMNIGIKEEMGVPNGMMSLVLGSRAAHAIACKARTASFASTVTFKERYGNWYEGGDGRCQ